MLTQECHSATYLPTFRHKPMRSQLASQPANEEPALFVHIFCNGNGNGNSNGTGNGNGNGNGNRLIAKAILLL